MSDTPSMSTSTDLEDDDGEADSSQDLSAKCRTVPRTTLTQDATTSTQLTAGAHEDQLLPCNVSETQPTTYSNTQQLEQQQHQRHNSVKKKHKTNIFRSKSAASAYAREHAKYDDRSENNKVNSIPAMTVTDTDGELPHQGKMRKDSVRYFKSPSGKCAFRQRAGHEPYQALHGPEITIEESHESQESLTNRNVVAPDVSFSGPDCYPDIIPRVLEPSVTHCSSDQPRSLPSISCNQVTTQEQGDRGDTNTDVTTPDINNASAVFGDSGYGSSSAREQTMPSFLQIPIQYPSRRRHSWICRYSII